MVDKYEALERLSKLRADGVLTDDEFAAEKARLLAQSDAAPDPRVLPSSHESDDRTSRSAVKRRAIWMVPLALLFIAVLIGINMGNSAVGPANGTAATAGSSDDPLPACDSADVRDMLTRAYENSAADKLVSIKVLDVANLVERSYDAGKPQRICATDMTLNSGEEHIGFRLYLASTGGVLFQSMEDPGPTPTAEPNEATAAPMPVVSPTASRTNDEWEAATRDAIERGDSTAVDALAANGPAPGVRNDQTFMANLSARLRRPDPRTGRLPVVDPDVAPVYTTKAAADAALNANGDACIVKGENVNGAGWLSEPDGCETE